MVLGGARSGKSAFAEGIVPNADKLIYIATAEARDEEMKARIALHQKRRGPNWRTIEAPLDIVSPLKETNEMPTLLDCLTLWLSNLLEAGREIDVETQSLTTCLQTLSAPVVIVSNEVGQGVVPDNALARQFRDNAGRLNQAVAAVADQVYFVTAGIPTQLK